MEAFPNTASTSCIKDAQKFAHKFISEHTEISLKNLKARKRVVSGGSSGDAILKMEGKS